MKKYSLFVFIVAAIFWSSCNKEDEKTGTINGTLQFQSGEPIPFSMILLKSEGVTIQQTFSDDNGYFTFKEVPAGDYIFLCNHSKYKTSKPVAFSIAENETLMFKLIFTPIISLKGLVRLGGYPYPTNKIELFDNLKIERLAETYLDLESQFEFYNVTPGIYYLKLTVSKEHIYSVYTYLWDGSSWVWGPFDIESFSFQDVYYPIEIEQDLTREVVLNVTWTGDAFEFNH